MTAPLSGWCSGPGGDQCHVNPCRSKTCPCPRRQYHIHERCETQDETVRETSPSVSRPTLGRYTAVERADGLWEVIGPDGLPAKISGQTTWATEDGALRAERNGNRRKAVRS